MRANTPARTEQSKQAISLRATNDLNDAVAILQRAHLLFSLIEELAQRGDFNEVQTLSHVGMQIIKAGVNEVEFSAEFFAAEAK